jgi:hypothetical protein
MKPEEIAVNVEGLRIDGFHFLQEEKPTPEGYYWDCERGTIVHKFTEIAAGVFIGNLQQALLVVAGHMAAREVAAGRQMELVDYCSCIECIEIMPVVASVTSFSVAIPSSPESRPIVASDDFSF